MTKTRAQYIVKAEPRVSISAALFNALAEWRSALAAYSDAPDIDTGRWMNDAEEKLSTEYDKDLGGASDDEEMQSSVDLP